MKVPIYPHPHQLLIIVIHLEYSHPSGCETIHVLLLFELKTMNIQIGHLGRAVEKCVCERGRERGRKREGMEIKPNGHSRTKK